jgi:hypothetical protein
MTEQRVGQIVKLVAESIPDDERSEIVKQRRDYLDLVRSAALEIVEQPAKPSFAPNGKELVDRAGNPILDHSERLAAMDRVVKLDERLGKLTGTDTSTQQIDVTHHREAQKAAEAMSARVRAQGVIARFPTLTAGLADSA